MFKQLRFAVLLAGVTLAVSAWAQPAPDEPPPDAAGDQSSPAADPPTRVGRLSYLKGDVSFVPAGENDWVEAQLNRPLITGDKLWTDRGSRAELAVGPATLRIDQDSSFDFLNLDDKVAQVELTQGSLNLHVRRLYDEQSYEIDTPTLAFVINRVGNFRVDVLPDGQSTVVTVLQGGGDAYGEGGARFRIEEGQSVTFHDPQLQSYESSDIPRPDEFDEFVQSRDHRSDNSGSRRFVSEEVIGYEDLDDNGEWNESPEYGSVWYPTTVAAGWTPYHNGHWGWVGAYGWTWIDDASWGFAPFHYGRWAYVGNRWGWCPGPVAVRAVYAPALVAFVGGGGVAVGFGTGPVGWFPLGPRDVYYPSYRVSERYFVGINVGNSRHFDRGSVSGFYGGYRSGHVDYEHIHYGNREVAGAVVAVPHAAFVGAHNVGREAIAVNHETFANSRVSGFAAVAPTHASLAAGRGPARVSPPAGVASRPIVAASRPPAPVASFASRENSLQKNPGQPLTVNQIHGPAAGPAANNAANGGRQNVRVVTNAGTPVRTVAPAIPAHTTTGSPNAAAGTSRVAPNATLQNGRGAGPAVQNNAASNAQNNAANNNAGRPSANSKLDSSRFAHPQTGGAQTGPVTQPTGQPARVTGPATGQNSRVTGPATQSTGQPARVTGGQGESVQRATTNNAGTPKYTPTQTPSTSRPSTSPATGNPAASANSGVQRESGYGQRGTSGGGASGGAQSTNQYHAPVQQSTQQVHAPASNQVQQRPTYQQPQQQVHAPVSQPQSQVQQQSYHAPVQNTGQMQGAGAQQQIHQPPPQPQPKSQPANRPAPQGKDKKDDDKRH